MSAEKSMTVHGMKVSMWETSFKVEGMGAVVHVGKFCTEDHIRQLVSAIYTAVVDKATKESKKKLAAKVTKSVLKAVSLT